MATKAKITCLVPVFGSNRLNAELPGQLLAGCKWIGIPFAGGMPEVKGILDAEAEPGVGKASMILVNDRHSHIVNCAMVAADPKLGPALRRKLRRLAFHPLILRN